MPRSSFSSARHVSSSLSNLFAPVRVEEDDEPPELFDFDDDDDFPWDGMVVSGRRWLGVRQRARLASGKGYPYRPGRSSAVGVGEEKKEIGGRVISLRIVCAI